MLLLGTTDTPYEGDPAEVAATEGDIEQVLGEAGVAVDPALLRRERVLSTYAGLRVLPQSDGETVDARRETAFLSGRGGMLTVAGGKLTTYRRIALDALGRLSSELGLGRIDRAPVPLPGATDAGNVAPGSSPAGTSSLRSRRISPTTTERERTGSSVSRTSGPSYWSRIHPEAPDIGAQVVFAAQDEWATSVEDIVQRRTSLAARGLTEPTVAARVGELLGQPEEKGPARELRPRAL